MGLSVYLLSPDDNYVRLDSQRFPEHPFKVGCFYSEYNEWGLNSFLNERGLPSLYEIFDVKESGILSDPITPDWETVNLRIEEVIRDLKKSLKEAPYKVRRISFFKNKVDSSADAFSIVTTEKATVSSKFETWISRKGLFSFKKPLKVVSVMLGENDVVYVVTQLSLGLKRFLHSSNGNSQGNRPICTFTAEPTCL